MSDATALENARLLIASIQKAMARGCVHRDRKGSELTTVLSVLDCLKREGSVLVEEPKVGS